MNCFPIYLVSLRLEDRQWCNLSWVLLFWLGLGCLLLPLLSIRFGHQLNYIPLASIKDHYEKVFFLIHEYIQLSVVLDRVLVLVSL